MKPWKLAIASLVILTMGLVIVMSCGDDDDDDNDTDATCDSFCQKILDCGLAGDLDLDSMEACVTYCEQIAAALGSCVLEAADCNAVSDCFGAGDDDDSGDDDDDDDDDDDTTAQWPGPPWYGCTDEDIPAGATVVTAFDKAYHYYGSGDNFQTLSNLVDFPKTGDWSAVTLRVDLTCPEDGFCDAWDRFANIYLLRGADKEGEEVVELLRYITPYRTAMCMLVDVSSYMPLLKGAQTINSYISTWVGPDSGMQNGNGWVVTAKFIFHPATKDDVADNVINIWPYMTTQLGDPANPVSGQMTEKNLQMPATVSRAELRLTVTGHGQGNRNNCAEFCNLEHRVTVNGTLFTTKVWRSDCGQNPIGPQQQGSWAYSRAGWCPGAVVEPLVFDVTSAVTADQSNAFTYTIWKGEADYENTCRPGAGDPDNYCAGCAFDDTPGNCDYNGGNHTSPVDYISSQLHIWE